MSKERIVCVEWIDACYNSGYYEKEKDKTFDPAKTRTVGFVIRSDRQCLKLSHDRFYDEKDKMDDERHITTIPKKMIRKITELKG